MAQHSGFQIVRRHTSAQEEKLERRLGPILSTALSGILNPSTGSSTTASSSPAASSTPTTTAQTPTSSSGGSSGSGSSSSSSNNSNNNSNSNSNSGGTTPSSASSGNSGSSSNSGGDTGSNEPVAGSQATAAAGTVAGATNVAATSAAGSTAIAATATQAALSSAGLSSTSLMTEISTAANGSVFSTVLPIGYLPSANPFGNIANSTAASSITGVSGIITQPTGTASNQEQDKSSGSSKATKIAVPVAVVLGVLALGLVVAFFIRRQRKSMERDVAKPLMLSKNKNGISMISAGAGSFGFTAAGIFKRGRRGSGYGQESSQGHGAAGVEHRSWLAGRPMSEEGMYADNTAYAQEYNGYNDDANLDHHPFDGQMDDDPGAAGIYTSNDQAYSRHSITSGEGGYLTASEEGADPFTNRSRDHFDGSAPYGYSNNAAAQGANGGQNWAPYPDLRRNSGNDSRRSINNTSPWEGGEEFAPVTAERSPNRIMQHPQHNSSRWSG